MKVTDVIRIIENGWLIHSQLGSHRQFKYPAETGRVTVAGHPSLARHSSVAGHRSKEDVAPGTLSSILKQAGLKP